MFKLGMGLVGAIIVAAVWWSRQGAMKRRLQGFDDGTLCVGCHSQNMVAEGSAASCRDCGHRVDLAAMRATQLTDADIKDITRPQ